MDFSFTEEQQAVAGLAEQIFSGLVTDERVKEVERTPDVFDRELWAELAKSGLLGVFLPADHGGSGLGMTELCLILEQQGRRLAHVPLLWGAVAALLVDATAFVAGDEILTCAFDTDCVVVDGLLSGVARSVPWAHVADRIVVAAGDDMVVVDAVAGERVEATNHEILSHLRFDGVPGTVVGRVAFAGQRARLGLAALQLGVAEEALRRAAEYTSNRIQFGKPLSSFQSTSAKAADAYIDVEAMRVTMWQAAWRLDTGLDASTEIDVAKWWASEGGQRVVHATQHMHGGMGADIEYPIHRYFLWGKQIEDTLGGGSFHLARIGSAL